MTDKLNSKQITIALSSCHSSPVRLRSNYICATNISWGLFSWGEADYVAITKSRHLVEVEIKVSYADFIKDREKKKFVGVHHRSRKEMIRRFYYAAPQKLAERILAETDPDVGVIAISITESFAYRVKVLREAKANTDAAKVTDDFTMNLARLQTFRWFRLLEKIEQKMS